MFCTACAAFNQQTAHLCRQCGAALPGGAVRPEARSRASLRRVAVGAIPVLLAAMLLAGLIARQARERQSLAATYDAAVQALASGQLLAAREGFVDAGGYRDARQRAADVDQLLAPYDSALEGAEAAISEGRFEEAIVALREVARALPDDERPFALMEAARAQWLVQLQTDVDTAERSGDWLAAERALMRILAEDPGRAAARDKLADVRAHHMPFVFTREGVVYIESPDLSSERAIVHGLSAAWPVWSPDRSRLAFVNYPPDRNGIDGDLYVVDVDGANLRMVAERAIPFTWPVWSPDGSRIAFTSSSAFDPRTGAGHIPIFMVELATGAVTDLTGDAFSYAATPTWSPDGTRIAFVDRTIQATGSSYFEILPGDVQVVDVATRVVRDLSEDRIDYEWWVSWSPNSEWIAVMTNPGDWSTEEPNAINVVQAATGDIRTIPTQVWRTGYPYWSPDGSRLAFVEGDDVIRIWSEAGEEWIRVTTDISLQLSWAPDGQALLVPAATSVEPSYVIPVTHDFGARLPIRIEFDGGNGPNGPPLWGPRTAPAPTAELAGTALDRSG